MTYVEHHNSLFIKNRQNIMSMYSQIKNDFRISLTESLVTLFTNANLLDRILPNQNTIIYYSKTKYDLLFQRPQQIMRFFDKTFNKIFIGLADEIRYEEKYNLYIVPYEKREKIYDMFNETSDKMLINYYMDSSLHDEIQNRNGQKLFDLIDVPIGEISAWNSNFEKCVKTADYVMYSHPELIKFLNDIDSTKRYHYVNINYNEVIGYDKLSKHILKEIINFNNYSYGAIQTYVINMKTQIYKYKRTVNNLKSLNLKINRFDAISGKNIDRNNYFTGCGSIDLKTYTNGQIGCFLSHIFCIKEFYDNCKDDYCLIL